MPETITKVIRAECKSDLSIEVNGDDTIVHLTITGLPGVLIKHMLDNGEKLSVPMIQAIMKTLGALSVSELQPSEVTGLREEVHTLN